MCEIYWLCNPTSHTSYTIEGCVGLVGATPSVIFSSSFSIIFPYQNEEILKICDSLCVMWAGGLLVGGGGQLTSTCDFSPILVGFGSFRWSLVIEMVTAGFQTATCDVGSYHKINESSNFSYGFRVHIDVCVSRISRQLFVFWNFLQVGWKSLCKDDLISDSGDLAIQGWKLGN